MIQRSDQPIGYEISTSAGEDGTIEAAYIRFSRGPVAETREINGDVLLADFDKEGNLVGVEILAPVKISELTKLHPRGTRLRLVNTRPGSPPRRSSPTS